MLLVVTMYTMIRIIVDKCYIPLKVVNQSNSLKFNGGCLQDRGVGVVPVGRTQ